MFLQISELYKRSPDLYLPGQCVAALASDKNLMQKSGLVLTDYELARRYQLYDANGSMFFFYAI